MNKYAVDLRRAEALIDLPPQFTAAVHYDVSDEGKAQRKDLTEQVRR